jgi:asparagine synthase (glutamine-hydrolysing)
MCGICGYYFSRGKPAALPLETMNAVLAHRGPDDAGIWVSPDGRVGLANRRLAIIDTSSAGHQPMSNEDGSVRVVYNGEVYNHLSLRGELQGRGHQFVSRTDSETLVHLYEECREEMVHRLRGMFAFAIWDAKRRRLFIARDRLGIKPLYFAEVGGGLVFGSEIKAILASGASGLRPRLHRPSLLQFIATGHVSAPDTLFEGIKKLPPGHILMADEEGLCISRYWDVFDGVEQVNGLGENDYVDRTLELLEESVRIRMVADVPVGVFLSGGIDSSLVAALAARSSDQPIKTFTLGFRDHPESMPAESRNSLAQRPMK